MEKRLITRLRMFKVSACFLYKFNRKIFCKKRNFYISLERKKYLSMNQSTTLQNIREGIDKILANILPLKSSAILFGSRARGDARNDSDWDVLILLDKDRITQSDIDEVSYPIRELGWKLDAMVNPIMYTMKDWNSKSFTPFYKNVMREGVAI